MTSPVRTMLVKGSSLHPAVNDGLGALERGHKQLIDEKLRPSFVDSLDIDKGLQAGNEQENRWDYLLGHGETSAIVGFEPHSAYTSEVSTVIGKKSCARKQLRHHMKSGSTIAAWFWVASGRVDFAPHEKIVRRLDQEGITFVGGMLRAKDLLKAASNKPSKR